MSENFLRMNGAQGQTWGEWECPECGRVVQSDITMGGLDCPDCGAVVVEK